MRSWGHTGTSRAYVDYISGTGIRQCRQTSGNVGAQMLTRDLGDGRTEVLTLSWWESFREHRAFAGDDIGAAVFYPEDDNHLVGRENTVTHYDVDSQSWRPPSWSPSLLAADEDCCASASGLASCDQRGGAVLDAWRSRKL